MDINVGDRIELTKSIYDDGEDHHPPSWIAMIGEVLIVKAVREKSLAVAPEDVKYDRAFCIYEGEYKLLANA